MQLILQILVCAEKDDTGDWKLIRKHERHGRAKKISVWFTLDIDP